MKKEDEKKIQDYLDKKLSRLNKTELDKDKFPINARKIYEDKKSKEGYINWIKRFIIQYGMVENEDYIMQKGESTGGRPSNDYYLTPTSASVITNGIGPRKAFRLKKAISTFDSDELNELIKQNIKLENDLRKKYN